MTQSSRTQVQAQHYTAASYDTQQRFASYWAQIDAVQRRSPRRILEIGAGNGFVANYLRQAGVEVVVIDIDSGLVPSVVGEVGDLPFGGDRFDLVLCCQVLEHLPFNEFDTALKELSRVAARDVVLSLPDVTPAVRIILPLPGIGELVRMPRAWWRRPPTSVTNPREHHWEVGMRQYPLQAVERKIRAAGFRIRHTWRLFENPFHRFFDLSARGQ